MVLSVIICTYNRDKYIQMVLRSLEKQTLSQGDFEVLIVNNNSLDNTEEIVQNYLKKTSLRIQYMIEYNQGVSYARNRGVGEAKGDIIVFLDDDETVEPDFLFNIKTFSCDSRRWVLRRDLLFLFLRPPSRNGFLNLLKEQLPANIIKEM